MKREILVERWLKSANGDHKEAKNQKRIFEWYVLKRGKRTWESGELMNGRVSLGGQGWLLIKDMWDQKVRTMKIKENR